MIQMLKSAARVRPEMNRYPQVWASQPLPMENRVSWTLKHPDQLSMYRRSEARGFVIRHLLGKNRFGGCRISPKSF